MTTSSPRSATLPIVLVLAVALAAGLGLLAAQHWFGSEAPPVLQNSLMYPQPRELPAFALDQADGEPLDADALRGRWSLLFVGFTHCPDVCPTTLAQLAAVQKQLADLPPTQQPRIVFVSVDPERDTAKAAQTYASHFSPDVVATTADHARLEPFTRNLGMVYMQSPLDGGGYTVDHSASVAVLDPEVRLVAQVRPPLDPQKIAADVRQLIERAR